MITKSFLNRCEKSGINVVSVVSVRKKFVLIHRYNETGKRSIVAFSNDIPLLQELIISQRHYGSSRHDFFILNNCSIRSSFYLKDVKDKNLLDICNNVAQYLSIAEYAMLKKSFFKSSAWFEKAKNSAVLGAEIINNY